MLRDSSGNHEAGRTIPKEGTSKRAVLAFTLGPWRANCGRRVEARNMVALEVGGGDLHDRLRKTSGRPCKGMVTAQDAFTQT